MTIIYGGKANQYWKTYMDYSVTSSETSVKISIKYGIYGLVGHSQTKSLNTYVVACTGFSKTTTHGSGGETRISEGEYYQVGTKSYTISKGKSAKTVVIAAGVSHSGSSGVAGGSEASKSISIAALKSWSVKYNANGGSGAPAAQTKWYGTTLKLSTTKPTRSGYAFKGWATSSGGSVAYASGANYTANNAVTLYAVWSATTPPSFTLSNLKITGGRKNGNNAIANFSTITATISGITVASGRSISSITSTLGTLSGSGSTRTITFKPTSAGTYSAKITVKDSAGLSTAKTTASITVVNPTWKATFDVAEPPPTILSNGDAWVDSIQVMKPDESYETVTAKAKGERINDNLWRLTYTFDAAHVSNPNLVSVNVGLRMQYKHYETNEKDYRKAFYSTTRNQNYSNGIYNTVFVSGVSPEAQPNYTSRVWWSAVNNPLYFPDTNYAEVGSNDTAVMGLTKVGSYLGAIKQSKTTDTAIYLLYPTSFEENTTFAVKQGVQGIGALAKYSFNILGDESLFLSPNGVMAIVPTDDEEHKVQNRSYFVDGRLLKEENIADAYSFVFDGKYWLSVNGHCYVLDGNQRNSWGNDRTNLVYECYYLENIPAICFAKINDELVFTDGSSIMVVSDGYVDAFNNGEENVPVSGEWSTILDDDGSVHYFKTMQKKGNLVSILPTDYKYDAVAITEDEFNNNPKQYYILVDGEYVNCEFEEYSGEQTYYVRGRSNTKVYVKKDENDPVEIQRKFGLSSKIPSEMILKKKFKKYKRLQFIVRNEEPEPFGVDEIIKSYTVGNYSK